MRETQREIEEGLKTDYRAGNFLPENYISKEPDPRLKKWAEEAEESRAQVEELEQKLILFRNNLNL